MTQLTRSVAFALALLLLGSTAQAAISLVGLKGYYPFDTNLNDASGNSVNPINAPTGSIVGGHVGGGAYDDDDTFIDYGTGLNPGSTDFTVAGWVRGFWVDGLGDAQVHLGNTTSGVSGEVGYGLHRYGNANFTFFVHTATEGSGLETGQTFGLDFSGDHWIFMALVVDQTGGTVQQFGGWDDGTDAGFKAALAMSPGTLDGGINTTVGSANTSLFYDDWSFWGRALTHDEVLELYNGGAGLALEAPAVPEPASLVLAGLGFAGLGCAARWKNSRRA